MSPSQARIIQHTLAVCLGMLSLGMTHYANAEPWFTGPILAPAGKTTAAGHTNLEFYGTFVKDSGFYDKRWRSIHSTVDFSDQYVLVFSHGLAQNVDFQFVLPYIYNVKSHHSAQDIGDVVTQLGYQVLSQPEHGWIPNVRFTVQETIPTGRFEQLNSTLIGTDITGRGTYQTTFNLNFQDLSQPLIDHYIRTRLSLGYTLPGQADVGADTLFGTGNFSTDSTIHPGNTFSLDLASEITLTQNWVAVLEGLWTSTHAGYFTGNPGVNSEGKPISLATLGYNALISVAPALEYNFSDRFGIIAGSWFTVAGKNNSLIFKTITVAFNAYW